MNENSKEKGAQEGTQESVDQFRRKFLRGCGITVLTAASYHIISVFSKNRDAHADMCNVGCVSACVDSCTGCTTVNCTSGNVPDPGEPMPVD